MGPAKVPIKDPCPFGLPVILTVAHMGVPTTRAQYSPQIVGLLDQ